MAKKLWKQSTTFIIVCVIWSMVLSSAGAESYQRILQDDSNQIGILSQMEVWVDDDFNESTPGWGVDHFDTIQAGVDNVTDGGSVYIYDGIYDVFLVDNRFDLLITAMPGETPVVEGCQQAWDGTLDPPSLVNCVVFVNISQNVNLYGLDVQGVGLSGRSYAVFYNGSQGVIYGCRVSPNERGNMNSLGIRAQWNSQVTVENSTVENYGRIGIYCRTGTVLEVYNCTLIGQIYTDGDGDFVSYGIEVEDLEYASEATICYNEIYNHHHTGAPTWSSAGIIVDAWRYYEVTEENCSAVIECNDIHDNMIGVQIVPNDNIHVCRNMFCDNVEYGAVSDPYWDGQTLVDYPLDAVDNWWGDASGPYHPDENPEGLGDAVSDHVVFVPWVESLLPGITLTKPQDWFLYITIGEIFELKLPFFTNLIIGPIEIEVDTMNCMHGTEYVEFYLNEELKYTDETEPYSWLWDDKEMFFLYTIKVVAHDGCGNIDNDSIPVWRIF